MISPTPIVARAPVRISFAGGGTDLPEYYERFGGLVLSAAIARYCYVIATPSAHGGIRITSADYGACETIPPGEWPDVAEPLSLPKAAIERFMEYGLGDIGVDLFLASEVPPGTGLGSSSAMAVALVRALSAHLGVNSDAATVAEEACELEIQRLAMPIGKQDQYASAFGGVNTIEFERNGTSVSALHLPRPTLNRLDERLMLFSTGRSRNSKHILCEQRRQTQTTPAVAHSLHLLKDLAREMTSVLQKGDLNQFGDLLHKGWELKKTLSGKISSSRIDALYESARDAGALGGKITGAGGGGFLLLYCAPERQSQVRSRMSEFGVEEMPFRFERDGARVLTSTRGTSRSPVPLFGDHSGREQRQSRNRRLA